MKVIVIGAGGIVGQEMIRHIPENVQAVFTRTESDETYAAFNVLHNDIFTFLDSINPDVIVNLSGVNNVDLVENATGPELDDITFLNEEAPVIIAKWANENNSFFIQGSTQAVFSGDNPPYSSISETDPINLYGHQKANAEKAILSKYKSSSLIARLTFVYGIRPNMNIGRANPLESMMAEEPQLQVDDRYFSPLWSVDAANILWELALAREPGIVHIGEPITVSRYTMACHCAWDTHRNLSIKPVSHEFFQGTAARAYNTSWRAADALYKTPFSEGILNCYFEWRKIK